MTLSEVPADLSFSLYLMKLSKVELLKAAVSLELL